MIFFDFFNYKHLNNLKWSFNYFNIFNPLKCKKKKFETYSVTGIYKRILILPKRLDDKLILNNILKGISSRKVYFVSSQMSNIIQSANLFAVESMKRKLIICRQNLSLKLFLKILENSKKIFIFDSYYTHNIYYYLMYVQMYFKNINIFKNCQNSALKLKHIISF